MNIYELQAGQIRHFVAAETEEEAYKLGTDPESFPDMHWRPFDIRLVQVEGYTVTVTQESEDGEAPKSKGRARKAST